MKRPSAEDFRRRLIGGGVPGLPTPQLKKLGHEMVETIRELEQRIEEREVLAGHLYAAAMSANTVFTGGTAFVSVADALRHIERAMRAYEALFPAGLRCDEAGLLPGGVDCPGCAGCSP